MGQPGVPAPDPERSRCDLPPRIEFPGLRVILSFVLAYGGSMDYLAPSIAVNGQGSGVC